MNTKKCTKCGEVKHISNYSMHHKKTGRIRPYCKDCGHKYSKIFISKNPPEYGVWNNIKSRCYIKSTRSYPLYGGRGITVCDRWKDSFKNFYSDMGPRPSQKHQIDRINNDGNYTPDNCKWSTPIENSLNRRGNKIQPDIAKEIRARYISEITTIIKLSKEYNISKTHVSDIIQNKTHVDSDYTPPNKYKFAHRCREYANCPPMETEGNK